MQGTWTFSVSGEVRGRNVTRQQQLDLVMVELPDTVYLRYEEQEVTVASLEISTDTDTPLQVRDDDRQRAISARLGRVSVECVAEGGRPEPSLSLFAGGSNLTEVTGQGGRYSSAIRLISIHVCTISTI